MEYHKFIYHRKPTELEQLVVQAAIRKEVADATWTECDNASPLEEGQIWHFGFGRYRGARNDWDGYLEVLTPGQYRSVIRWRVINPPYPEIPHLQYEEV